MSVALVALWAATAANLTVTLDQLYVSVCMARARAARAAAAPLVWTGDLAGFNDLWALGDYWEARANRWDVFHKSGRR